MYDFLGSFSGPHKYKSTRRVVPLTPHLLCGSHGCNSRARWGIADYDSIGTSRILPVCEDHCHPRIHFADPTMLGYIHALYEARKEPLDKTMNIFEALRLASIIANDPDFRVDKVEHYEPGGFYTLAVTYILTESRHLNIQSTRGFEWIVSHLSTRGYDYQWSSQPEKEEEKTEEATA